MTRNAILEGKARTLKGLFEDILDRYEQSLQAMNRSPKTISWYKDIMVRFAIFIQQNGLVKPIQDIGTTYYIHQGQ